MRGHAARIVATRPHCSSVIHDRVAISTFDHAADRRASFRFARVVSDRKVWLRIQGQALVEACGLQDRVRIRAPAALGLAYCLFSRGDASPRAPPSCGNG